MSFGYGPNPYYKSFSISNHTIHLLGSLPMNLDSTIKLLQKLDNIEPALICLTGYHPDSYKNYKYFRTKKNYSPVTFPYKDEDLMIKSKFTSYFHKDYPSNLYYYNDDIGNFYYSDYALKRCITDDNLSCAHWSCLDNKSGLVAAGAHPFMVHEGICHSISLPRLREIFHNTVEEYLKRSKSLGWEPVTLPTELYYYLNTISKLEYPSELLK
jgi:hypothetical protein